MSGADDEALKALRLRGWRGLYRTDDFGTLRLEVDGIVSVGDEMDFSVQPMFQLVDDGHHGIKGWRQMWNAPPTEAELDWWVKNADEEWDFLPVCDPTL